MQYKLLRTISGKGSKPGRFVEALRGLALDTAGLVYAVGDSDVKVFEPAGTLRRRWRTGRPGYCVAVAADGTVYVGEAGQIETFDPAGRLLRVWRDKEKLGRVTAIGLFGEYVLAADASDRCIRRYDKDGRFRNTIGKDNRMKGFLIPNGHVDLSVDARGIIHAPNPGQHRVQRYTLAGKLLGHFGRFDGRNPEGFPGCCNPTNVAVTKQGHVVVTEKAVARVKVYTAEGKLLAVFGSDVLDRDGKNLDVAVDAHDRIYVADPLRLRICVFAPQASVPAGEPAGPAGPGVSER